VSRSYGAGARILSIGIASTGVFSFLYLAFASHVLSKSAYGRISLLWSIMFVILSVIYRPIEQLLSRTIADRRARGIKAAHTLRVPAMIQASFAATFLVAALALRHELIDHLFDGSSALYVVLVVGVSAYAASYFARGWLAGNQRFELYGGLVLMESTSRFVFAIIAAVGITHGQTAIAIGMAVAPFVSLVVVPLAFSRAARARDGDLSGVAVADAGREGPAHAQIEEATADLSMRHGAGFAAAVFLIMLAEQTLVNAAVIAVNATSGRVLAGFVFNVLLIVRAPLQLFQAIQTSLLPHLAGLEATESDEGFHRAIRLTSLVIGAFAGLCAVGLLAIGPFVMGVVFGHHGFHYGRGGLALVALGMGLHLTAGTLNQAALARGRAPLAAIAWLLCAALFVGWVASPAIGNEVLRTEVGYFGAALVLCTLLYGLYRRPAGVAVAAPPAGAT
jgi:O-antigen/teichoic acid export membrane protein